MRKAVFSYLPTSRRGTREIRPRHSLSRAQHRTAPYTEHYLSNTSLRRSDGRSLSCSISLLPSTFLPFLSWSTCPFLSPSFYLGLSLSVCLSLSLSLSPPSPRSRRQEKSFVVGLPFLQHLLLTFGGDDRAVSMCATPRLGTTTVMTTATATSPIPRATRDVIRRKRKKKRKRLPAARARARERDDPASSYARDSVWATTEERICTVPA